MTYRCSAARTRTLTTSATGLLLILALVGCATTPSIHATPPAQHGEVLHASPMTMETMNWLTEVQTNLDGDPRLGAIAIDQSRSTVTITWFGDPGARLDQLIARAPIDLEIVVQSASFLPGDLQNLVARAVEPNAVPGVEIAMGHARNDGSGLEFGIVELPWGLTEDDVAALIADSLERPDIPITVTVTGAVRPADAQPHRDE